MDLRYQRICKQSFPLAFAVIFNILFWFSPLRPTLAGIGPTFVILYFILVEVLYKALRMGRFGTVPFLVIIGVLQVFYLRYLRDLETKKWEYVMIIILTFFQTALLFAAILYFSSGGALGRRMP